MGHSLSRMTPSKSIRTAAASAIACMIESLLVTLFCTGASLRQEGLESSSKYDDEPTCCKSHGEDSTWQSEADY